MKGSANTKSFKIKKFFKGRNAGNIIIMSAIVILIYLLISFYFAHHFFFNTVINGVNVSLKSHADAENIIKSYVQAYRLQLIERNGETEEISSQDVGMEYNEQNSINKIYDIQNAFKWISPLIKSQRYYVRDLFVFDLERMDNKISELNCLNRSVIEPQNVSFAYSNGSYEVIKEKYGNKIHSDKLYTAIKLSILKGETKLDLNEKHCYENPRFTLASAKTADTQSMLNRYVRTKITYKFGNESEVLDGNIINNWLNVDENLDAVIDIKEVTRYVRSLSKRYDTVGIARNFKTSVGKIVEVEGGLYGWKIDRNAESKALLENIKQGDVIEKEPVYAQRALTRGMGEIGNTYVEINITRQQLWFYKDGKLVAHGSVVTGNPNRGYSTVLGTYMLNYKQKGATLVGEDYESEVTYWMPFFGNIGIHDASWRHSFGGKIYKRNGSHGCVNAPKYLAKKIFEKIEAGTPIICYEEEESKQSFSE